MLGVLQNGAEVIQFTALCVRAESAQLLSVSGLGQPKASCRMGVLPYTSCVCTSVLFDKVCDPLLSCRELTQCKTADKEKP